MLLQFFFFFEFSYFSWGLFLSLLYIIGEREFFLTVYLFWGCPLYIYIYRYIYCIRILELPLEVWIVRIDLGPYSSKLFLPHLFMCIMFLFFLGFLRFILFYIYYICDHFGIWIFYPFLLFSYLPIWVICSLYSTFCMYGHLPKFFCSFMYLSFLLIILLICFGRCYYKYCILFQVLYIYIVFL